MSDTLVTIIGIFLTAVLMFVFPLMTVSNTQDNIAQVSVQSLVAEFVNNVATKGKITQDDYNTFISKLYATGNTYDVQLEHKKMTTNPNKGADDQIGENLYYSVYNSVIIDSIETGINYNEEYLMKKGDYIIVTVKNTNTTIASQIKNFVYSIIEKDINRIAASSSALVVSTGSNEVNSSVSDDVETNNPTEIKNLEYYYQLDGNYEGIQTWEEAYKLFIEVKGHNETYEENERKINFMYLQKSNNKGWGAYADINHDWNYQYDDMIYRIDTVLKENQGHTFEVIVVKNETTGFIKTVKIINQNK